MTNIFWSGRKVVLTGKLNSMTRDTAVRLLKDQGAIIATMVSKQTDDVIPGNLRSTSRKLSTAKKLKQEGVSITLLTEEEFLNML